MEKERTRSLGGSMANGRGHKTGAEQGAAEGEQPGASANVELQKIAELQDENERLRRIVTDLLLEKVSLEEALGSRPIK